MSGSYGVYCYYYPDYNYCPTYQTCKNNPLFIIEMILYVYLFLFPVVFTVVNAWLGLEWSLLGFSILAFCMAIPLLVLASIDVCCSNRPVNSLNMVINYFPYLL